MKAMIFAAGLGTRLRPLTDNCPKALIEVNSRPILERVIMGLKDAGVSQMVINIHYLGRMIRDFLDVNDNFGIDIAVSDESDLLLDTGGAILRARQWLDGDEPFMVHNADILTDLDYKAMLTSHIDSQADATLLVADRSTSRYLLFDDRMRLHGWQNIKTGESLPQDINPSAFKPLAFGGIHILNPNLFDLLEEHANGRKAFPVVPFYLQAASQCKIMGYQPSDSYRWVDIGKPETLQKAQQLFV